MCTCVQVETLNEAHRLLPDGCDVIKSLEESKRMEWNGDVDLGDGRCQLLHQEYVNRVEVLAASDKNVIDVETRLSATQLLQKLEGDVTKDVHFLHECMLVQY